MCLAQPQWKFHIAFEDATGAKDTLWLIWDTTAHGNLPIDTALGEGPAITNYNIFNVWVNNDLGDSTKTLAAPYSTYGFLALVNAFNYQYPISIRWDSSLFHAPYLPMPVGYINRATIGNDYYFGINNDPFLQAYNMLLDNQAIAPAFNWGSQTHFPMEFYVARDPSISVDENENNGVHIYPNPVTTEINISNSATIKEYEILSIEGKSIFKDIESDFNKNLITISCKNLRPGIYFLKILNNKNQIHHEKIIKLH